jgi:hypothetical protein
VTGEQFPEAGSSQAAETSKKHPNVYREDANRAKKELIFVEKPNTEP